MFERKSVHSTTKLETSLYLLYSSSFLLEFARNHLMENSEKFTEFWITLFVIRNIKQYINPQLLRTNTFYIHGGINMKKRIVLLFFFYAISSSSSSSTGIDALTTTVVEVYSVPIHRAVIPGLSIPHTHIIFSSRNFMIGHMKWRHYRGIMGTHKPLRRLHRLFV